MRVGELQKMALAQPLPDAASVEVVLKRPARAPVEREQSCESSGRMKPKFDQTMRHLPANGRGSPETRLVGTEGGVC